jgi:hypothetical protein
MRHRIKLDRSRWTITHGRLPADKWAECDYGSRTITISKTAHGDTLMDCVIHELLHARFPDLAEPVVDDFASILAAILHQMGFRQLDEHDE